MKFCKVKSADASVAGKTAKKSQKSFNLSAFNFNWNQSILYSTLGAMDLQRWELFSGSPGT